MNSTSLTIGTRLSGRVSALQEYYGRIQLDAAPGFAIVHISQLSDEFLPPPMSAHLSVGDRVTGEVVGVDRKTGYPEISPKKLCLSTASDETRPADKPEECRVLKVNDFYALLDTHAGPGLIENLPGRLSRWSRYAVLVVSGLLAEGRSLKLRYTGKRDASGRRKMAFPVFPVEKNLRATAVLDGEIISWRLNNTGNKRDAMLRDIVYVHTGDGFVVRVECNYLMDIADHYSIGDKVRVCFSEESPLKGIPFGTFVPAPGAQRQPPRKLSVGETVTGKVVRLLPGGVVVLIADNCPVYLPAKEVMPGKGFVGSVLQCGDFVEGVVVQLSSNQDAWVRGDISFSRLVEPSTVSQQKRSLLVDVTSEKRVGIHGGFGRDAAFRVTILEAHGHICCFCGQNFSVGGATPMEAAHILPRAKRGADTVANALCLCPVHHWAFGRGLWTLDDARVIRVASRLRQQSHSAHTWLTDFHGKSAAVPLGTTVSSEALEWHRRNVFLDADDTGTLDV